ncbi:MAG: AAA family ATPase [Bacteroidales bacterium]|nr:AAA family ATPase [Bacteroidales bacterium]
MNYFIKNIHINKLFHLENFDIPIANEKYPHLIITGKNGSGKTVLLNAIATFFDNIKDDTSLSFLRANSIVELWENQLRTKVAESDKAHARMMLKQSQERVEWLFGKVNVQFCGVGDVIEKYNRHVFIISFYQADRKVKLSEPNSPTKPKFQYRNVRDTSTFQFLNFMSDLKIQEALARNEKQFDDADEINAWFVDFEKLLQQIFQDDNLKLEFNYKDYSFKICTEGKKFKFTQLSDGFAAALDIVADLILKMQDDNSLTRFYQKEGIVLIDEIETHLHLGLQKIIMPLLTKVFPNIQFIITTHSPFVLSSMPNAVAYDLEHKEILDDLTEYSYEALAEGYFGVKTEASYMEMQLNTFKNLLEKEHLTDSEIIELKQLKSDFEKIPETVSPLVVGEFRRLLIQYMEKFKELSI